MSRVFIGGSRRVRRLHEAVERRLDCIVDKGLSVLLGDANGADKAVQVYLQGRNYKNVVVFCTGSRCRNNVAGWPTQYVRSDATPGTFDFYASKDRAMAEQATHGFMLWDGKSVGTLMNVLRLVHHRKKSVIFLAPDKRFIDIRSNSDWDDLLATCPDEVRHKLDLKSANEARAGSSSQPSLL